MRGALALPLAAVVAALALAVAGCGSSGEHVSQSDRDLAVDKAQSVYRQYEATGQDLTRGPCISNGLAGLQDWVVDLAHDPRQPVDDEVANQCSRYRSGQAHHFVELDEHGTLIRAE